MEKNFNYKELATEVSSHLTTTLFSGKEMSITGIFREIKALCNKAFYGDTMSQATLVTLRHCIVHDICILESCDGINPLLKPSIEGIEAGCLLYTHGYTKLPMVIEMYTPQEYKPVYFRVDINWSLYAVYGANVYDSEGNQLCSDDIYFADSIGLIKKEEA